LEQLDNLYDFIKGINFVEVIKAVYVNIIAFFEQIDFNAIWNGIKKGVSKLFPKDVTLYEIAYFVGFVATFFIPFGWVANLVGRAGKAGRVILKAYALIDDLMAKVFGFALKKGTSIFKNIIQFLRGLFRKFNSGKNAITETIKELFDNFTSWLNDVFPKWRNKVESFDELLRQVDDLIDDLGGKRLYKKELDLLKTRLFEKYDVRLRFVDKDHKLGQLLIDWDKRNVVGKFDPGPPPEMLLRSNNASELTVFHEMVHLKVWYHKLPKMHIVDEEKLVFEAIFKKWKETGKFTNEEMIDSYLYVNEKIVKPWNKKGKKFEFLKIPEIEQLIINKQFGL